MTQTAHFQVGVIDLRDPSGNIPLSNAGCKEALCSLSIIWLWSTLSSSSDSSSRTQHVIRIIQLERPGIVTNNICGLKSMQHEIRVNLRQDIHINAAHFILPKAGERNFNQWSRCGKTKESLNFYESHICTPQGGYYSVKEWCSLKKMFTLSKFAFRNVP